MHCNIQIQGSITQQPSFLPLVLCPLLEQYGIDFDSVKSIEQV